MYEVGNHSWYDRKRMCWVTDAHSLAKAVENWERAYLESEKEEERRKEEECRLKPCPFCGYKKVYVLNPFSAAKKVVCNNCGTEGPIGRSGNEAYELWNRRSTKNEEIFDDL